MRPRRAPRPRTFTFALALALAMPVLLPGIVPWLAAQAPGPDELTSRVDEIVAARAKRDHYRGSVLIAREGKILLSRGYGLANQELDVPNSPQTKFRLGSITKQFTAMAILILQHRGKLNVQDKLKKHMPDAPKSWDEITIHHLLSHTAGIPNYTEDPTFLKTLPVRVILKELIGKFKDRPLDFKPGEKFKYSNSGYVVLGQVIESASGQDYASFLRDAIFTPLEMRDTGYDNATAIIKHRAAGYTRRLGILTTNCDYVDMSIPHAAGALYSTTLDLLRWDQALDTEKLLPRALLETMFRPVKDNYGYGWAIDKKFGLDRQHHGGGIMGFSTAIARYPGEKLLVVVLGNMEGSPAGAMGDELAAIAVGRKYVVPRDPRGLKLDGAVLEACVGDYELEAPGGEKIVVSIIRDGDRLYRRVAGGPKLPMIAESETRFYIRPADSEVTFVQENGKVSALRGLRDGQDVTARRKAASIAVKPGS